MPRPPNPELPEQLLAAATVLLDEHGDAAFSMRELAGRVGYAVTAVYRCFQSRADLLRALQLRLFQELTRYVDPAETTDVPVDQRVGTIGRRYLEWALEYKARYRFIFHTTETYALLTADERTMTRAGLDAFEQIIASGWANSGSEGPLSARATAVHVFAALHGLASLALTGRMTGTELEDLLAFYDSSQGPWLGAVLGVR